MIWLEIGGNPARTICLNFYELGTTKVLEATVRNGPQAVDEAMIWTSSLYEGHIGIRLAGGGTWSYPGPNREDRFLLGDLAADEGVDIEIQLILPLSPGKRGENYIPLLMGNGEPG